MPRSSQRCFTVGPKRPSRRLSTELASTSTQPTTLSLTLKLPSYLYARSSDKVSTILPMRIHAIWNFQADLSLVDYLYRISDWWELQQLVVWNETYFPGGILVLSISMLNVSKLFFQFSLCFVEDRHDSCIEALAVARGSTGSCSQAERKAKGNLLVVWKICSTQIIVLSSWFDSTTVVQTIHASHSCSTKCNLVLPGELMSVQQVDVYSFFLQGQWPPSSCLHRVCYYLALTSHYCTRQ